LFFVFVINNPTIENPMHVEIGGWCVDLLADNNDSDIHLLKLVMQEAKKEGVTYGSVGVIPLPPVPPEIAASRVANPSNEPPTKPYVTLLRCGEEEVAKLLQAIGVDLNTVPFSRIEFEE